MRVGKGVSTIDFVITFLLVIIAILLFEINSKLPKRDYVKEAMLRDEQRKIEKEMKLNQNDNSKG